MAKFEIEIPEIVANRARLLGAEGEAWLAAVPKRLRELETEWQISATKQLDGGTASLVFSVEQISGKPAVLKMRLPGEYGQEMLALRIAQGDVYAKLLVRSVAHNALLLEHLGGKLADSGQSTETQMDIICDLLQRSWQRPEDVAGLITGAEKAQQQAKLLETTWNELDQPCNRELLDSVLDLARQRAQAFDPEQSCLVHGDAHIWNTLACAESPEAGYKLVDPEGLFAEPALDLAILMREWVDDLLAGDTLTLGRERLTYLSERMDVAAEPIWQWAIIEQLANGLILLREGQQDQAVKHLTIAKAWVGES